MMKPRLHSRIRSGASIAGVLLLGGCNAPSPSPPSSSSQTTTKSSSTTTKVTTTTADDAPAPQRKPAAGMGNAIGRVLFDGKAAPNIEVQLCSEMGFIGGCSGKTYPGKTNKDGYYVIDKVKPGSYALAVRVFNTNKFIYPTSGIMSAAKFEVKKDKSLSVPAVNLWKTDLRVLSPSNGATVKTGQPKLAWKAYPNAANYKVSLRTKDGVGALQTMETSETSIAPEKALLNGDYQWRVEASNADGTKIAETDKDATFKVVGQAGSSTVQLINPKVNASVKGAGLTLQWKAHPQAQEYRVYLKGLKAKDPTLRFESMTGTSHKLAAPLPADTYFWSVEAYKDNDKIAGSRLERFTVK